MVAGSSTGGKAASTKIPSQVSKEKPTVTASRAEPKKKTTKKRKSPGDTIKDIITTNTAVLFDLLSLYGFKEEKADRRKVEEQYLAMVTAAKGDWMSVYKYKTAAFFAFWKKNESIPKAPFPPGFKDLPQVIMGGRPGRFLALVLNQNKTFEERTRAHSLLSSLSKAKKGFARPTNAMVRKKEAEFFKTMTRAPDYEAWGDEVHYEEKSIMCEQIRRTVEEIFGPEAKRRREDPEAAEIQTAREVEPFFPSTSANYINNVREGGSVAALLEHPKIQAMRKPGGFCRDPITLSLEEFDQILEETRAEQYGLTTEIHNTDAFTRAMAALIRQCVDIAQTEQNVVIPVGLPEPLKVRVITKGPPFRMFVLKWMQRDLHNIMRKHRCFRLIGDPNGGEEKLEFYLEKILQRRPCAEEEIFVSGDYKAATDNLKSWASIAAAEHVATMLGYSKVYRELLIAALTEHEVEYKGETRKQTQGQLMGSIVSFVFLCIVNAAVTRFSAEAGQNKPISLEKAMMAFNGDDVVFRTTKKGKEAWQRWIAVVGLEESVGKTFFSKEFLQINSTDFTVAADGELTEVPFVNMGLVTGLKRSGGKASFFEQGGLTIGARYRKMLATAPKDIHKQVHCLFKKYNSEVLKSVGNLPWYVEEWLGGLGLTGLYQPSEIDRRIAQRILYNWKQAKPLPLNVNPTEWHMRELAMQRIRGHSGSLIHTVSTPNEGVVLLEQAVHVETLNILLDSTYSLEDLKMREENVGRFARRRIRHNQRLWKMPEKGKKTDPILGSIKTLPPPLTEEQMKYIRRYESFRPEVRVVISEEMKEQKTVVIDINPDAPFGQKATMEFVKELEEEEWPESSPFDSSSLVSTPNLALGMVTTQVNYPSDTEGEGEEDMPLLLAPEPPNPYRHRTPKQEAVFRAYMKRKAEQERVKKMSKFERAELRREKKKVDLRDKDEEYVNMSRR